MKHSANGHPRRSTNQPREIIPPDYRSNAAILTDGKSAACNPPARSSGRDRTSPSAKPWPDKKSDWSPLGKECGKSISNILNSAALMNANAESDPALTSAPRTRYAPRKSPLL